MMLLGLPLVGITLTNQPIGQYLEFPPRTLYVKHAPFSWIAFICYSLFILTVIVPYIIRGFSRQDQESAPILNSMPFPWWGWFGILFGITAWFLAWNRFHWCGKFQAHTFSPLWIAYILTINALTYKRTGHCMMLDRTRFFLFLFPTSAAFWWFFEYLNRFVQNWYYVGGQFGPWEYFLYSTLPFSTVLPAVMATREWLHSLYWPVTRFQCFLPIKIYHPKVLAWLFLLTSGVGLAGIGVWPNYLFPLLWISPLTIFVSLQAILQERHIFSDISHGDWQFIVSSAMAALICGFFWEMWNYYSFAKWKYNIPLVHRFQIFEMPILGYAGYLPFGVECAVIADIILMNSLNKTQKKIDDTSSIFALYS